MALIGLLSVVVMALVCACYAQNFDAFNAVNTAGVSAAANPLTFDKLTLHGKSSASLNSCSNAAYSGTAGLYWVALAVDVPSNTQANVRLLGTSDPLTLVKSHTWSTTDTMFKAGLVRLASGASFTVSSAFPTAQPPAPQQTYLAGFRLDGLMSPVVGFHVARTSSFTTTGQILYDRVLVDTTGSWNALTSKFTAPQKGIYLFTFSSGTTKGTQRFLQLAINGNGVPSVLLTDGTKNVFNTDGVDLISRIWLANLNQGDVVTVSNTQDVSYSDAQNLQTAFSGFLYSPANGQQIAWSVSRTDAETNGAQNPLVFQTVNINVGNAWQASSNQVIISVAGTYYVHVDAFACYSNGVQAFVNVNGQPVFAASTLVTNNYATTSKSQAAVIKLDAGSKLTVSTPGNLCIYSRGLTTFSGILLFTS